MEDSNSSSTSSEDSDDYEALPKVKRKPSKSHIHNLPKDENKYYYYGPDNCLRKRYRFCGDCSYKTPKMERLLSHIKYSHPSSKTALPPPEIKPPKPAKIRIKKRGLKPPPDRLRAGTVLYCSKWSLGQNKHRRNITTHKQISNLGVCLKVHRLLEEYTRKG